MSPPTTLEVHLDTATGTVDAGVAYSTVRRGQVTTLFDYAPSFLADPSSFDLSPTLRRIHRSATAHGLPGAFADCAPDRWGRNLIRRRLHAAARAAGSALPSVTDVDFLCGVSDVTRQGALRFRPSGGPFVAEGSDVPPLVELPALLAAARRVAADVDDLDAVAALLAAGSASLGGARPKASVCDGDRLSIAKFPHGADEWDVMAWEATALEISARCGIDTPVHRLEAIGGASVLLVERFDRSGTLRIPYISAMSLLDRNDGEMADYVEIAEALAAHGGNVSVDLRELWRRIALSIALNNTDDHLRNHGFLHVEHGWQLAPVFDINPNPDAGAHRVIGIGGATDRATGLRNLVGLAETFGLDRPAAIDAWNEIRDVVSKWRTIARGHGIAASEQRRFIDALDGAMLLEV